LYFLITCFTVSSLDKKLFWPYPLYTMCYNCGCGLPEDDMGQGNAGVDPTGKSITEKTFEVAAKSQGMSVEEAKKNALKLLKEELGEK